MITDILKALKVNHYIKNIIVVIPLLFSMNFTHYDLWLKCLVIFVSFCFISSAVYIMNDLIDIEKDKLHPVKCNRPIASGRIPKSYAISLFIVLLSLSTIFCSFLNIHCTLMILSYLVLNIFYSLWLKNIALVDASCIAIGFIFRIVAGCFAISVIPSPLVILMTFFVSMFFTFTKRKLELQLVKDDEQRRKALRKFDVATINQFVLLNAILSIAFYFTYVLDQTTIQRVGTEYLYLTVIPFTLIIFRLLFLVNTSYIEDDPIHFIEQDQTLKYMFLFYAIVFALVFFI